MKVEIIERKEVELEEFWVIRGIEDIGVKKTVVAEHTCKLKPRHEDVAQFLLSHPEATFASVEHNYALVKED